MSSRVTNGIGWLVVAVVAAVAFHICRVALSPEPQTPIDDALPLMALVLTFVAWATRPSLLVALPLLLACAMSLADERVRLLAFGFVVAATFLVALVAGPAAAATRLPMNAGPYVVATGAIALLRWLPLSDVLWPRELVLLAIALAIVAVLRATPIAVATAVIVAFVTPLVPLNSLGLAFAVLLAMAVLRLLGFPRLEHAFLPAIVVAVPLFFFAWSGIVARALPLMLRRHEAPARRELVNVPALAPTKRARLQVPEGAHALIVSGANVPRRLPGAVLGSIEPGGATIRIGDAADWGYMRREHWYRARNVLPRNAAGVVHGYGYTAWIDGAGRVPLPAGAKSITVIADPSIPHDAALQLEAFEMEPR